MSHFRPVCSKTADDNSLLDGHYEAVLAQAQEHGAGYPAFVRKEFERYLLCGRLSGG